MPARIRLATPDDARGISVVHVRGWQTAYRGIVPDEVLDALDIDERTEQRRGWLETPRDGAARCWVLEAEGEILGFVMTGPTRDADLAETSHELYAIYVAPESIGTGCGRRLMDHTVADLAARGFEELVLWVLSANASTRRFYAAAGFARDVRVQEKQSDMARSPQQRLRRPL